MLVYVSHSKSNIVVCELENDCNEGYELFGFSMSQPTPNVQYLSQADQMGYGILSQSEQMGYGFSSIGCVGLAVHFSPKYQVPINPYILNP
jgi:hypothetical protein